MTSIVWKLNQSRNEKASITNNPRYTQYVLKDTDAPSFEREVFSPEMLKKISSIITLSLKGVDPQGRDIVVPMNTIKSVLTSVIETHIPETGDIYSKYQVMFNNSNTSAQDIINKTIEIITYNIRNETEMITNNNKLDVWDNLFGDFNKHGLLAHPPIKLKNKRPDPFLFHMKY